jgi:hypothetical protein
MKLLNLLLDIYKDEYELNLKEGLIKTTNIGKTLNILEKKYQFKFIFERSDNSFYIKTFHTDINTLQQGIIKDADVLGWFPSYIETDDYSGKWNLLSFDEGEIKIRFEAKFDDQVVENIPSILYHITPTQNADKILKIGLIPRSRSKASYHPDRVYLAKSLEDAEFLGSLFRQKTGIKNWTIIKIITDKIPGDYLKLYTDPNFKDKGYYTLNNIPAPSLEKIKDIIL